MLTFKQFLLEGIKYIPGQGHVFVPDAPNSQMGNNTATSSTQPIASTTKPPTPVPTQTAVQQRQLVMADPSKGIDISDIAEPIKDSQGNVTSYRIRGHVGTDEYGRSTVKSLRGSANDIQIWQPREGYTVTGTSDRIIQFAKQQGVELRGGLADLLGNKGELIIPKLKSIGAAGIAAAGAVAGSALTQSAQAASDVLAGVLTQPDPKTRMEVEKGLNTDVGLGFDYVDGELAMSPEGSEAVRRRQKQGYSFPTAYPSDLYK